MANCETILLSRIITTGQLSHVIDWGISSADFRTAETRTVWEYIAGYYSMQGSRGSVFGPNYLAAVFPNFQLVDDPFMTMDALCYEVRKARVTAEAKEAAVSLIDEIELDPVAAIGLLQVHMQRLTALGSTKNSDITIGSAALGALERYKLVKTNQFAFAKIAWPWEVLNELTGGIQESDYIVLFGRPKSMKTWVLNYLLASAYQQEKTALIYTKEMTAEQIYGRIISCIARLPYQELRTGKLSAHDEMILESFVRQTQDKYNRSNLICLSGRDVPPGQDNVAWLHSKVKKYQPSAIFIDGMYLLSDASSTKKTADWQRVTNISRAIRDMVLDTKVPAICTMQATRGAAKHSQGNLDEIAYADAVAQDATLALRVINEKTSPTIALVAAGSREFQLHGFRIHGIPATNFEFKEILSEKDIKKAEEQDVTMDEPENGAAHAKPNKKKQAAVRGTNGAPPVDVDVDRHFKNMSNGL